MSKKLLRETIRALVREAAVPVTAAIQQGLALYVANSGKLQKFVLYDPQKLRASLTPENLEKYYSYDDVTGDNVGQFVVAYFETLGGPADSCSGAKEVSVSSAQKGFGPMMYDICMSFSYPTPIMPDRSNVTPAAANVWRFYAGRNDVKKVQLSDDDCKLTDDPNLNVAIKGQPANYSGLMTNHQGFMKELGEHANEVQGALPKAGLSFFDSVY